MMIITTMVITLKVMVLMDMEIILMAMRLMGTQPIATRLLMLTRGTSIFRSYGVVSFTFSSAICSVLCHSLVLPLARLT
jgi:hypothetical protein